MRILIAIILILIPVYSWGACSVVGTQRTAASCYPADITDCITGAIAGDTVNIPAGTCHWTDVTGTLSWAGAPANVTLKGAGTTVRGGEDKTVIIDDNTAASNLLNISITAGVDPATPDFRLSGITFQGGTGSKAAKSAMIQILGPGNIRIDHCTIDTQSYNTTTFMKALVVIDRLYGVIDANILKFNNLDGFYIYNGNWALSGRNGFNEVTGFGGANYLFIENNYVNGNASDHATRIFDGYTNSRVVVRYNTLVGACASEDHYMRSIEVYRNSAAINPGQADKNYALSEISQGTALIWGNVDTSAFNAFLVVDYNRADNTTYNQVPPPTGWGYCGPAYHSGTVDVDGTAVTHASGDQFHTDWPAGSMIYIVGASCTASANCVIASVESTTGLTLASAGGSLTGVAYTVGSRWDGNTDVLTGYPCLDQPGRGLGDLLQGDLPTVCNKTLNPACDTFTGQYPRQASEPIYIWANTSTLAGGSWYVNNSIGRVVADRDYYVQASGAQSNPTTPFDGTTGTGWGTFVNRPTTCTTGVAYFSTDTGSMGTLYKCTATNTWTSYYTPYTCPHPLTGNTKPCGPGAGYGYYGIGNVGFSTGAVPNFTTGAAITLQ